MLSLPSHRRMRRFGSRYRNLEQEKWAAQFHKDYPWSVFLRGLSGHSAPSDVEDQRKIRKWRIPWGEERRAQLSSPGFLSSPWLFTPFLVSPIPHVSPTGPVVSLSPKKLHEALEAGVTPCLVAGRRGTQRELQATRKCWSWMCSSRLLSSWEKTPP